MNDLINATRINSMEFAPILMLMMLILMLMLWMLRMLQMLLMLLTLRMLLMLLILQLVPMCNTDDIWKDSPKFRQNYFPIYSCVLIIHCNQRQKLLKKLRRYIPTKGNQESNQFNGACSHADAYADADVDVSDVIDATDARLMLLMLLMLLTRHLTRLSKIKAIIIIRYHLVC